MGETETHLAHLIQYINDVEAEQKKYVTFYIGIGTASVSKTRNIITNKWSIEPRYEHQYPMFLSTLKKMRPFDPLHIILIDPGMEDLPFVVCDEKCEMLDCWEVKEKYDNKIYFNADSNITVYPVKCSVLYPYDNFRDGNNMINIGDFMSEINDTAILNNWLVIFQDYSGKNVSYIGEYYSDKIEGHHDHLVYGIAAGLDGGCYIDLTHPACDFVYKIDETKKSIKVIVPRSFDKDLSEFMQIMNGYPVDSESYKILNAQGSIYAREKKKIIIEQLITIIRQITLMIAGGDPTPYITSSPKIEYNYKIKLCDLYNSNNYKNTVTILKKILVSELKKIAIASYGDDTVNVINDIIVAMGEQKNMYEWTNVMVKFVNHCIECMNLNNVNIPNE